MKSLLTLFVLLFSFSVIADDISDFQIEGISIGDSLLDYMSEEEILKELEINKGRYQWLENNDKFIEIYKYKDLKNYYSMSFFVKPDDEKFLIYDINGSLDFTNDFDGCKKKQKEIVKEISKMFIDTKKDEGTYIYEPDPSNRSIVNYVRFKFDSGDTILIQCYDFEENFRIKKKWNESLEVSITPLEITKWFRP